MFSFRFDRRGQGALEYMLLLTLLLIVLFVFQKYIARGFSGRWQATGESFGQGRQYDPNKTVECQYYEGGKWTGGAIVNAWYNAECFNQRCLTDCKRLSDSYLADQNADICTKCITQTCRTGYCNDTALPNP